MGVTVAGLSNGLPSTLLTGLQYPHDMYVYGNGTVLVADLYNNRVTKWDPNTTVGVIIAGTGSYGSWSNLLAKPISLAGKCKKKLVQYCQYEFFFFQFEVNNCMFLIWIIIDYRYFLSILI